MISGRTRAASARVLPSLLLLLPLGCRSEFEGGGDLRAQKVVLEREVEGMREAVARLERGDPILPKDDIAIAIHDGLVRELIAAQLPFEADVDRFHLKLTEAEVEFNGSPVVKLRGAINLQKNPDLAGAISVIGALEDITVDPASSTLRAKIAVDHIGLEKAAGIEDLLSGAALDEVARMIRLQIKDALPTVKIPVKVQQSIDLPAVTEGPVRIHGATLPLQVAVSQVSAGQDILWIALRFQPGDLVKTAEAPEAKDASAEEAGLSLADDGEKGAEKKK